MDHQKWSLTIMIPTVTIITVIIIGKMCLVVLVVRVSVLHFTGSVNKRSLLLCELTRTPFDFAELAGVAFNNFDGGMSEWMGLLSSAIIVKCNMNSGDFASRLIECFR